MPDIFLSGDKPLPQNLFVQPLTIGGSVRLLPAWLRYELWCSASETPSTSSLLVLHLDCFDRERGANIAPGSCGRAGER